MSAVSYNPTDVQAEAERRRCTKDCVYFIHNYVTIEAEAEGGVPVLSRFRLWPMQIVALYAMLYKRLLVVLKARQLGLTWVALAYAAWRLVFTPGYRVIAFSKGELEAAELVRRVADVILSNLPQWACRKRDRAVAWRGWAGPTWEANSERIIIYHPNGMQSIFRSFPSTKSASRTFTANLLLLDEFAFTPYPEYIWSSAYPTINRPTGGQAIIISTMQVGTVYEEIWDDAYEGVSDFYALFLAWDSDPSRDQKWRDGAKRADPRFHQREYPATPEEAKSAGPSTFFPEFSRRVHVIDPIKIPAHWRRWIANDAGYNKSFAWYWLAVDEDGIIYVYREYVTEIQGVARDTVMYSEQATEVVARSTMEDENGEKVPEPIEFVASGWDVKHQHPENKQSIEDYYRKGGLTWGLQTAPRDPVSRAAALHEALKTVGEGEGKKARLRIFSNCYRLIESLGKALKSQSNPEVWEDPSNYEHYLDALGHGLMLWYPEKSKAPQPEKSRLAKHKERRARFHRQEEQRARIS